MASIKTLLGTDSIKTSRITLNENFAALNQELTEISELLVDFENNNGSSFNGTVTFNLIPNQTETYDLGSPLLRFRDIYLSNNTIYMGQNSISMSGGNLLVNGGRLVTDSRLLEEVAERARLLGIETTSRNQAISTVTSQVTSLADSNAALAQTVNSISTSFDNEIADAISGETLARTAAVSAINQTLTSLTNANEAISQSVTDLGASFTTEIAEAVGAETASRTAAISNINQTLTSLSNANEALAESVTDLSSSFTSEIGDAISTETAARTEAISDINQTLTSLSNANQATAQSVTNLSTSFSSQITGAISTETLARQNALAAEVLARTSAIQSAVNSIPGVDASGFATTADLEAETTNRISAIADEAAERARLLGIETEARTSAISGINQTLTTLNDANSATAQSVTNLSASFASDLADLETDQNLLRTNAIAGVESSISALTTANEAVALSVTNLGTQFGVEISEAIAGEAAIRAAALTNISEEIASLSNGDGATTTRLNTLEAQYTIDNGSVTGFSQSSALKTVIDSAIATANQATVTSTTNLIAELEDQTAGVTQSMSADINALTNKVNAQYTLEVNADGNVAGMRLGADENGSSISFTADSFKVSTGGPQGQLLTPFSIIDGQVAFNGAVSFSAGPQGAPGATGPQGIAGTNGLNGLDGADGLPGAPGADGVSTYFHIAYADNASGGGFSQNAAGKLYIGTYVDTTAADAASGSNLWNWQLVKGADGVNGENGIPGVNGVDGQTSYLHIAYANNPSGTSGFSTTDSTGKLYLGTYTDFTEADSSNPALYTWVLVKGADGTNGLDGEDGLPGAPGADGVSSYFHVAYADTASGGGFSQSPVGKLYIGTYVDNTQADAASGSNLWKWQLVKGADGQDGENGIAGTNGVDGQTSYLHIAYANNATGTSGFSTTDSIGKLYLGTYTDFTQADSTNPALYKWTLIKGADGINGVDGADGADGAAGASARAVNLTCTSQVFTYNTSGTTPSPTNTVITAAALNTAGTVYYQFFKNDVSVQNGTSTTYTYTPQSSFTSMPDKIEVQIREGSSSGTVLARDQITMFGVKPGANGSNGIDGAAGRDGTNGVNGAPGRDGLDGIDGAPGTDGMTVIISNEAHTLPTTNVGVVTYTGSGTTVRLYEGATELIYDGSGTSAGKWTLTGSGSSITLGSITDSGNFATVNDHSNMTANIASITYTISGKRSNGLSFSFTKTQSFSKSIQGAAGTNGLNGTNGLPGTNGTNGVSSYFHIAYADNASGGGFSQTPTGKLYIGTYVDNTQADAASGSSLWKWQLVKGADGLNGANGLPGTNGANGQTSYLHIAYANNSSGTSGFSTTDATGKLYLGTYTDFTEADSSNPALYTWALVKGADGATGPQGPAPDTSFYLTTSTAINGGQITTGIIKNGSFPHDHTPSWNTYSSDGMGINLDQGAINARNFYIDPDGNAKFRGDIDITSGATVGGSPMNDFFQITDDVIEGITRPVLKMRDDAYIGNTKFSLFRGNVDTLGNNYSSFRNEYNQFANNVADRIEQIDPYGPGLEQIIPATTLSHQYIKRNDVTLEIGDLVKLDENNELVKASSVKDISIVGILWKEVDFTIQPSPLDEYLTEEKDTSEKDYQYRDSFGNKIPLTDRDQKSIWKVASLGDSVDVATGLQGIKVCNQNGPVLKGDLLCSSDIPGYAMKQPVEYAIIGFDNNVPQYEERQTVTSYTLGKCMEDCTFDSNGKATGIYGYLYCG